MIISGIFAIFSTASQCCPLRPSIAKTAMHVHFALNLVSLALANLVLVFAAIGIFRDVNQTDMMLEDLPDHENMIPEAWWPILFNLGLLITCAIECVLALLSAWKYSHILCDCFQVHDELETMFVDSKTVCSKSSANIMMNPGNPKDVLVSAWLGNQQKQMVGRVSSTLPRLNKGPPAGYNGPVYVISTAPRPRKKQLVSKLIIRFEVWSLEHLKSFAWCVNWSTQMKVSFLLEGRTFVQNLN